MHESEIQEENHTLLLRFFDTAVATGCCLFSSIYKISNISTKPRIYDFHIITYLIQNGTKMYPHLNIKRYNESMNTTLVKYLR